MADLFPAAVRHDTPTQGNGIRQLSENTGRASPIYIIVRYILPNAITVRLSLDLGLAVLLAGKPQGSFKFEVQRVDDDAEKSQRSQA